MVSLSDATRILINGQEAIRAVLNGSEVWSGFSLPYLIEDWEDGSLADYNLDVDDPDHQIEVSNGRLLYTQAADATNGVGSSRLVRSILPEFPYRPTVGTKWSYSFRADYDMRFILRFLMDASAAPGIYQSSGTYYLLDWTIASGSAASHVDLVSANQSTSNSTELFSWNLTWDDEHVYRLTIEINNGFTLDLHDETIDTPIFSSQSGGGSPSSAAYEGWEWDLQASKGSTVERDIEVFDLILENIYE